jgi:hypothetical protein
MSNVEGPLSRLLNKKRPQMDKQSRPRRKMRSE